MIRILTGLIDRIESRLADAIDVDAYAVAAGTTGYHLRRMFSALTGMPVSEYIRRRRMTAAAADLLGDEDQLTIAVRYGYGSIEAFAPAFRAVHGSSVAEVRRSGGPLRSQPQIRLRLTVEGSTPMESRITERPAFRLIGHSTRVPLQHRGPNPVIQRFIAAIPAEEHARLKLLSTVEPAGLLQVTDGADPDAVDGTELDYLHAVAVGAEAPVPAGLVALPVPAGTWAVFTAAGPYPSTLQEVWAATATEWFPAHPWRLRPGPSIVAVLDRAADFSTATCELRLPVERA